MPRERPATPELVRELAGLSASLGRRLGILIDRGGAVTHVRVGDGARLELPDLGHFRRGEGRLKGLRWVATSLRGGEPAREDLNALARARLDLLLLVAVEPDGEVGGLREAHLVPSQGDGSQGTTVSASFGPEALRHDLLEHLAELERAFEPAGARGTGLGQRPPCVLAVVTTGPKDRLSEELAELRALADAAGYEPRGEILQRRVAMDPHTLMGKGRVTDLASLALTCGAELVVVNEDLAPRQQMALEDLLDLRVIDRTQLILDIFAQRARTHTGKLQVEVARLRYMLPRLVGRGGELSQVGGGKGAGFGRTKGAGEKKLEIDRRRIRDRIAALERELDQLRRQGELRRQRRRKNELPHVALVGYTNVGKSTLFNRLTESQVLVKDELFASLDPTVRQRRLPSGRRALFSDTVGFVRRLPQGLVDAFRATLDEMADATILLHVADASDPHALERVEAVRRLLDELGRGAVPELLVFNKADALPEPGLFLPLAQTMSDQAPLLISARDGPLDGLIERVEVALGAALDGVLASADLVSEDQEFGPEDPPEAPPQGEDAAWPA